MQISPLGLTFVFLYLPNWTGTTRPPGLVHINPHGLPGPGLSDSRLAITIHMLYIGQNNFKHLKLVFGVPSSSKNTNIKFIDFR